MRFLKVLAITALIFSLSANAAFAVPEVNVKLGQEQTDKQKKDEKDFKKKKVESEKQQDPVKMMEKKKERVQELLKEGKIEKEKADEITARIDARIAKIKEFDSLTVPQKKEALKKHYKEFTDKKVKEGRMTQEKADQLLKELNEKVEKWDGNGYPRFLHKGHGGKHKHKKETE